MMYARSPDGAKVLATPGALASCPGCDDKLIAKCGEIVVWHWAHHAHPDCDTWFEPESEWHMGWKRCFDPEQVEVVIGPHRADAVARNTVIEFQHSLISTREIREREDFYVDNIGAMVWVFDAAEFGHRLDFSERSDWTQLPGMIAFPATAGANPVYQARCTCGAWRLSRNNNGWRPCWSCKSPLLPKQIEPPFSDTVARYATFKWSYRRPSHGFCAQPLFWDLGDGRLFHVITLQLGPPTVGFGRLISSEAFLAWYGGNIPDSKALEGNG
jgi:hypothetical protein